MKIKPMLAVLFATFCCSTICAQSDYDKRNTIVSSLNRFFDVLTSVNDKYEPTSANTIVGIFGDGNLQSGGANYFRYNGRDMNMEDFVQLYSKRSLQGNFIGHKFEISNESKNIASIKEFVNDQRWVIKGILKRTNESFREGDSTEDYLIKDSPVDLIIKYNGLEKEITILEININSPDLQKVYPIYNTKNVFDIDESHSKLKIPPEGGEWYCSLQSYREQIKTYPNISGETLQYGESSLFKNKYSSIFSSRNKRTNMQESSDKTNIKRERIPYSLLTTSTRYGNIYVNENGQICGNFPRNLSYSKRSVNVSVKQGNETRYFTVIQSGKIKRTIFDLDNEYMQQLDLSYSMKYGLGVVYNYHFGDSRFSMGGFIGTNYNVFRGIKSPIETQVQVINLSTTEDGTKEDNDMYRIIEKIVKPTPSNPYNDAKKYVARSLFLLQGGCEVTNWLNLNLGIGAALLRNKYYMKTAYGYTKYTFEKLQPNLPNIDDVIEYKPFYKNYYYKDKYKVKFALRPSIIFRIPFGDDQSLNVGIGYVITPGYSKGSSLDFSLGYTWSI